MPLADPGVYNSWTLQPTSRCPTRLTTLSPLLRSLPRCLHRPPTPLCLLRFTQHGLLCLQGQLCLHQGPLCLHRGPLRLPSLVAPPLLLAPQVGYIYTEDRYVYTEDRHVCIED